MKSKARSKQIMKTDAGPAGFPFLRSPAPTTHESSSQYFFMTFLTMNNLSNDRLPVVTDLLNLMADAPALRDAISAVAVYHRKQQSPEIVSTGDYQALQSYGRSVRHIKDLITSRTFSRDPSTLWTTFFLGLFEVCKPADDIV